MEVVVKKGDYLYDLCRKHDVKLSAILHANPGLKNPEIIPIGARIRIPNPRKHQGREKEESLHKLVDRSINSHKWLSEKLSDVGAISFLAGIASFPVILAGMMMAKDNLTEWGRIALTSLVRIGDNSYGESLRVAGTAERSAAMHGTMPLSSLQLGPVRPAPLFKALLKKDKFSLDQRPSKIVVVKPGDTLTEIAAENKITVYQLKRLNFLNSNTIIHGDVLLVEKQKQQSQDIRPGVRRTLRPLFSRLMEGQSAVSKQFHNMGLGGGEKRNTPLEGRWRLKRRGFQREHGFRKFSSPLNDGEISSPFGWRWGAIHEGVDLAAEQGTPVMAADRGTVIFAGWSGGYGKMVAIQHEGDFTTRYAHCSVIKTHVGKHVSRGEVVGEVGSTGVSTGPHLHFEVRRKRKAMDPFHWVYL